MVWHLLSTKPLPDTCTVKKRGPQETTANEILIKIQHFFIPENALKII